MVRALFVALVLAVVQGCGHVAPVRLAAPDEVGIAPFEAKARAEAVLATMGPTGREADRRRLKRIRAAWLDLFGVQVQLLGTGPCAPLDRIPSAGFLTATAGFGGTCELVTEDRERLSADLRLNGVLFVALGSLKFTANIERLVVTEPTEALAWDAAGAEALGLLFREHRAEIRAEVRRLLEARRAGAEDADMRELQRWLDALAMLP